MAQLPEAYKWLQAEARPKMLCMGLRFYGLHEAPGGENNPVIMGWAEELGQRNYDADDTPWCGLFMAKLAHEAGEPVDFGPLWARNWLSFGRKAPDGPQLGDVCVFERPGGGGHVALYVGEDADAYHVLGGNQSDAVGIVRKSRRKLLGARTGAMAGARRRIRLRPAGALSTNER